MEHSDEELRADGYVGIITPGEVIVRWATAVGFVVAENWIGDMIDVRELLVLWAGERCRSELVKYITLDGASYPIERVTLP